MIKIGITGGIGSGKTLVGTLLQMMDIPVYQADNHSKALTQTLPAIRRKLTALLGEDIYTSQGLNKAMLASIIFNDPGRLQQVNNIIHPEVRKHFRDWADHCWAPKGIIALESAILFESGFDQSVDLSLLVMAPTELRIARVMQRSALLREEILRRMDNQWPQERIAERAHHIIYNDQRQAVIPQVQRFVESLGER